MPHPRQLPQGDSSLHDFLKEYPAPVETEITGATASAATLIALSVTATYGTPALIIPKKRCR